jgi:hypothetical protein
MFFLLRMAFWLSVVVILLPTGQSRSPAPGARISAVEAVSAAGAAVSDLRQFCGRQPDACAVGSQAAVAFGHKAQASAKMLYEFLSEKLVGDDGTATGSITARNAAGTVPLPVAAPNRAPGRNSQNTLTPADLAPAWRGPMLRKEAQKRHPV